MAAEKSAINMREMLFPTVICPENSMKNLVVVFFFATAALMVSATADAQCFSRPACGNQCAPSCCAQQRCCPQPRIVYQPQICCSQPTCGCYGRRCADPAGYRSCSYHCQFVADPDDQVKCYQKCYDDYCLERRRCCPCPRPRCRRPFFRRRCCR